jgi:cytochrome bd ubiquinol oxidase subunit II
LGQSIPQQFPIRAGFDSSWDDSGDRSGMERSRCKEPAVLVLPATAFAAGSIVAGASQGVIVSAITQGIRVSSGAYIGGWLDWLSPFSLLTCCALVVGYALLGSTWLIWKTDGAVQRQARRIAFPLGAATLVALASISIATPLLAYDYWKRWFSLPAVFLTSQVPLSVLAVAIVFVWSLGEGRSEFPF